MNKIAITTKHELNGGVKTLAKLVECLLSAGKEVLLDSNAQKNWQGEPMEEYDYEKKVDLLMVLGGDGTVIRAVRNMKDFSVPMFGINMGRLGFLVGTAPENINSACQMLWETKFTLDKRMLLHTEIIRDGKVLETFVSLNEMVVGQSSVARLVELSVKVNDELIADFRSDGLIVATPTGSTAHSLSAGGPILHPKMEAFILTPICPHSFNQKPIVITSEKIIEVAPMGKGKEDFCITIDGQISQDLEKGDIIRIKKHPYKAKFLRLEEENFFKTIKGKLGWGSSF